jgi:uncharacterized delta-60 repeat protein
MVAVLLAIGVGPAQSKPGGLDPIFGKSGVVTTPIGEAAGASAVVVQRDGKIVAAGAGDIHCGDPCESALALARYKPNGSLDRRFGSRGVVKTRFGSSGASAVAVAADGKIVAAASRCVSSYQCEFVLVRFHPEGALERKVTTAIGSDSDAKASDVVLQPDGKIVVAGSTPDEFALARYNPDLTLDRGFGTNGIVTTRIGYSATANAVVLQPDGKLIVVGSSTATDHPKFDFALARYEANGSLDATFGTAGKVTTAFGLENAEASAVLLQPDGKVVAVGGEGNRFALARYQMNGALDPTFGSSGQVTTAPNGRANAAALDPTGRIVAAGRNGSYSRFALARYDQDGSLDMDFGSGGKVTTDFGAKSAVASGVALQRDGKIVAAGSAKEKFAVARYSSGKEHCVVPSVKGRRLRNAKRVIRRAYCSVGHVRRVFSSWHWKGRVISQKPKLGVQRRVGAKVRLVVGKGPRRH